MSAINAMASKTTSNITSRVLHGRIGRRQSARNSNNSNNNIPAANAGATLEEHVLALETTPVAREDYKTCLVHEVEIDLSSESSVSLSLSESSLPPSPLPSTTQSALLVTSKGYELVADYPVPAAPGPREVVIRNRACGLNHIDWMSVAYNFCLPERPWITGRELAGVVESVGSDVTDLQPGDRVWTTTYYRDRRAGCFQDLVVVPAHTVLPIPADMDFATAACLGVAGVTAAMTIWQWLKVPMVEAEVAGAAEVVKVTDTTEKEETKNDETANEPTSGDNKQQNEAILVWGGSTVTGQFAIQLAARAGLTVVAVCSSATASLVQSRGATHVITYDGKSDWHLVGEVLHACAGRLTRAVDLVGASTAQLVLRVVAALPHPVDVCPLAFLPQDAPVPANARVHTVEIKQFVLQPAAAVYARRLNELVAAGQVHVPAVDVLPGGLGAVEAGLAQVRAGKRAGKKLVVAMA